MKTFLIFATLFTCTLSFAKKSHVAIETPKNNEVVTSPVKIKMAVNGVKLCPANEPTKDKKCGHHHILVDRDFMPAGQLIPVDENHIHFGKMQTEAEVKLAPGKHKITLQFADYAHHSLGRDYSNTIEVEVK